MPEGLAMNPGFSLAVMLQPIRVHFPSICPLFLTSTGHLFRVGVTSASDNFGFVESASAYQNFCQRHEIRRRNSGPISPALSFGEQGGNATKAPFPHRTSQFPYPPDLYTYISASA